MKFSKEQVQHLARLAKLDLSDETLDTFQNELGAILGYVEQLEQVDVSGVKPTTHAVDLAQSLRPDKVDQRLSQDDVLRNAPDVAQAQFRVPKVVS